MKNWIMSIILDKATPVIGDMAKDFVAKVEAKVEASTNKWDDAALALVREGMGPALDQMWVQAQATDNSVDDLVVKFLATAVGHELN